MELGMSLYDTGLDLSATPFSGHSGPGVLFELTSNRSPRHEPSNRDTDDLGGWYLEDRERTLDTALDKVILSLTNYTAIDDRNAFLGGAKRECPPARGYHHARRRAAQDQVLGNLEQIGGLRGRPS